MFCKENFVRLIFFHLLKKKNNLLFCLQLLHFRTSKIIKIGSNKIKSLNSVFELQL